jgi:hypothetical protein
MTISRINLVANFQQVVTLSPLWDNMLKISNRIDLSYCSVTPLMGQQQESTCCPAKGVSDAT